MNDLKLLNAVPNKERGGGRERGKREKKRKREVTAVIRIVLVDQYIGVHDDSTPHKRLLGTTFLSLCVFSLKNKPILYKKT